MPNACPLLRHAVAAIRALVREAQAQHAVLLRGGGGSGGMAPMNIQPLFFIQSFRTVHPSVFFLHLFLH